MTLKNFYLNKNVFITGHTGFKGCWLALILKMLGAKVTGYSLEPPKDRNNLSKLVRLDNKIESYIADIRDYNSLKKSLETANPDIVFHLAAQPLVIDSYNDPISNYETNVMGTVHLLEVAKNLKSLKALVNVTTDKCYENKEWVWPYRENDELGGYDPYSASKSCSEIVTNSYRNSFYNTRDIGIATARAGNVIGGGDFAKDRIVPDIIKAIISKEAVVLRRPKFIRPWQYVLDVLYGYLILGMKLYENPQSYSEAFNFSPMENIGLNVEELTEQLILAMGDGEYIIDTKAGSFNETSVLTLDSSKARKKLNWLPQYNTNSMIQNTALWYKGFFKDQNISSLCDTEIKRFFKI